MKAVIKSLIIIYVVTSIILLTDIRADASNYFYMVRPMLGMDLAFEFEEQTRKGPITRRVDRTRDFTETLNIETLGWVYHPALATYSLKYSPEWRQVNERNTSGQTSFTSKTDSLLQGYDAKLILLPYKPYTFTLFAQRDRNSLRSNLAARSNIESTSYGAQLDLKGSFLPTSMSYVHSETRTSGFFTEDRNEDQYRLVSSKNSKLGTIRFNGSYVKSDDSINDVDINSDQQVYSLSYSRSFLEKKRVTFNSSLRYTDTVTDKLTNRGFFANETLLWKHRANLRSRYSFQYKDRELFDLINATETDEETVSGNIDITHVLYENLTTIVNAGALRIRNTGNEEVSYNGGVNFKYSRKIPVGLLQLNTGQLITATEVDYSTDFNRVIDENVSLVNTFTFLENENVDMNSIVVTDSKGSIYSEAGNYVLSTIGTSTRIRCIPGGQLDAALDCFAGAPVLISYDYRIRFPFDYLIHDQYYGVNLGFINKLSLYYRFSHTKQHFLRGIRSSTVELINDRSHLVGGTYKKRWSETDIAYENRQSKRLPLERTSLKEVITLKPNYFSIMRLSLGYATTTFKARNETEKLTDLIATYERIVWDRAKFSAKGFYHRVSSETQRTVDRGLLLSLDWIYRIYSGKIIYSHAQEKNHVVPDSIENRYMLFTLHRELF